MIKLSDFDEIEHNMVTGDESEKELSLYNRFRTTVLFSEKLTSAETKKSQMAQLIKQEIVEELRESLDVKREQAR